MKPPITVGRAASNEIVIPNKKVSGKHCTITPISNNSFLIEDLNSTNGTFKNGLRIKRSVFGFSDKIDLSDHAFDLTLLKAKREVANGGAIAESSSMTIPEQFALLEEVYRTYSDTKLKIQRGDTIKKTAIRSALALIPIVGASIGILASGSLQVQEKLMALEEEFKISYVCPKCKNFLGNLPWENLKNRGECRFCKVKWIN